MMIIHTCRTYMQNISNTMEAHFFSGDFKDHKFSPKNTNLMMMSKWPLGDVKPNLKRNPDPKILV